MSAARPSVKSMVAICAIVSLLLVSPIYAQEAQPARLPTIADCPRGYVLAVQDINQLMPLSRSDTTADMAAAEYQTAKNTETTYAAAQATAPRAFVTGCVLPQPQQPQQPQQ